jgi:hypothetical protein
MEPHILKLKPIIFQRQLVASLANMISKNQKYHLVRHVDGVMVKMMQK